MNATLAGAGPPPLNVSVHVEPLLMEPRLTRPPLIDRLTAVPPQAPSTFLYCAAVPERLSVTPPLVPASLLLVLVELDFESLLESFFRVEERRLDFRLDSFFRVDALSSDFFIFSGSNPVSSLFWFKGLGERLLEDEVLARSFRSSSESELPKSVNQKARNRDMQTNRNTANKIAKTRVELTRFSLSPAEGVLPVT